MNRPEIPPNLIYPPSMTEAQVREMLYWQPKVTRWMNTCFVLAAVNVVLAIVLILR